MTHEYETLEEFIVGVTTVGVTRIVLRRTDEHRPVPGAGHSAKCCRCELLAYHAEALHKCVLDDTAAADLAAPLSASGLEVQIVSGNIT